MYNKTRNANLVWLNAPFSSFQKIYILSTNPRIHIIRHDLTHLSYACLLAGQPRFYSLLIYSMVQSPSWAANWFAASQEIPHISRNPKVHYRTHMHPPTVSILGQPNPVYIPTSHLLDIHPNVIHPSKPRSRQWSSSFRFPHHDPIHPLSSPIRATCPAHLILLDFITRTILVEDYKSFSSSLCTLLHSSVTSSLLGPNILFNTMFSNTLSFRFYSCLWQIFCFFIPFPDLPLYPTIFLPNDSRSYFTRVCCLHLVRR